MKGLDRMKPAIGLKPPLQVCICGRIKVTEGSGRPHIGCHEERVEFYIDYKEFKPLFFLNSVSREA